MMKQSRKNTISGKSSSELLQTVSLPVENALWRLQSHKHSNPFRCPWDPWQGQAVLEQTGDPLDPQLQIRHNCPWFWIQSRRARIGIVWVRWPGQDPQAYKCGDYTHTVEGETSVTVSGKRKLANYYFFPFLLINCTYIASLGAKNCELRTSCLFFILGSPRLINRRSVYPSKAPTCFPETNPSNLPQQI